MPQAAQAATEYLLDSWQRTILTWDVLRERGNQYLEHEKSGNPPVLVFDYETVVDGRELAKPANYALVRIKPPVGYPAADPTKRPFVVIDPRAGHGPGIGGFKIDSEIGIALKAGHPCYFVMFYPQPVPGQTIESVCAAEVEFIRKVDALHPDAEGRPFVIGNCQGGWALMMLAALAPWLTAAVGVEPGSLGRRGPQSTTWEQEELKRLKRKELESHIEEGTLLDAWTRLLIYVRPEGSAVDERPFNMVRRMIEELKPENVPSLAALKAAVKQQAFVPALDEERAIAALPKLAREMRHRRQGFDVARMVMKSRGDLTPHQEERFRKVASILGLDSPVQELKSALD